MLKQKWCLLVTKSLVEKEKYPQKILYYSEILPANIKVWEM